MEKQSYQGLELKSFRILEQRSKKNVWWGLQIQKIKKQNDIKAALNSGKQ